MASTKMRTFISCHTGVSQDYKSLCRMIETYLIDEVITMGLTPLDRLAEYWARTKWIPWTRTDDTCIIWNCNLVIVIAKTHKKIEACKVAHEAERKLRVIDPTSEELIYSYK